MLEAELKSQLGLWKTLMSSGHMAYVSGNFRDAASQYRRAIRIGEQVPGNFSLLSEPFIQLSICMSALKQFNEAESLLRHALEINQSDPEADPILLASNHHELSVLLWRTSRLPEALQMANAAVADLEKSSHDVAELTVSVLKHKAVLLSSLHRYDEAAQLLSLAEAAALRSSDLGRHSLPYGQVLMTKALLLLDQGKTDEAQKLYDEGIVIVEMGWGAHNPKLAELCEIFSAHSRKAGGEQWADTFKDAGAALREWIKKYGSV